MVHCTAEDLIEVILPRLKPSLSTWQYLSARAKAMSLSSSPSATDSPVAVPADIARSDIDVAAMLHEYSALHQRVRSLCERVLVKHIQIGDDRSKLDIEQSSEKCRPTSGSKMPNDPNVCSQNDTVDMVTSSMLNTNTGSESTVDPLTDRCAMPSVEKLQSPGSSTDRNNTGVVSSVRPPNSVPSDSGVPPSSADCDSIHVDESQELTSGKVLTGGSTDAGNFCVFSGNKNLERGNLSDLPDSGIPRSTDSLYVEESPELNSGKLLTDGDTDAGNFCISSGNKTQKRGNFSDLPESGIPPSTADSDVLRVEESRELNSGKLLTGGNTDTGNLCVSSGNDTRGRGNLSDLPDSGILPSTAGSDSVHMDESAVPNSGKLLTDGNTVIGNFRVSSGNDNPETGNFCESSFGGLRTLSELDSGRVEMSDVLTRGTENSGAGKLPESDNFADSCGTVDVSCDDGKASAEVEKPSEESCSSDNSVPVAADDGPLESDVPRPCSDDNESKHSAVTVIDNMLEVSSLVV